VAGWLSHLLYRIIPLPRAEPAVSAPYIGLQPVGILLRKSLARQDGAVAFETVDALFLKGRAGEAIFGIVG